MAEKIIDFYVNGVLSRTCRKCGKIMPLRKENFPVNNNAPSGFTSQCKKCWNLKAKVYRINATPEQKAMRVANALRWKANHPERWKATQKRTKEKAKLDPSRVAIKKRKQSERNVYLRNLWLEEFAKRGIDYCFYCGFNECFNAIDFHHVDPAKKEKIIAPMLCRIPTEERLKEIKKCIPLCSNHHRMLHAGIITLEQIRINHEKLQNNRM